MSRRPQKTEKNAQPASETRESLEGLIGFRLRRLQGLFVTHWGRWYRDLDTGVTPVQGGILLLIGENAGLTQIALARLLKVEAPTLLQTLVPLIDAGLVSRERSAHDGRAFALHLTDQGRDIAGTIARESRRQEDELLSGLSPKDRAALLDLLEKALASGEAAVDGRE